MKLKIRPLTPNLWPALEDLFGENGACNGCWCMYWRIGNAYRNKPGPISAGLQFEDMETPAFAWICLISFWLFM